MLSLRDSNILKGVALLLLFAHHLFYVQNGLYDDVNIYHSWNLVHQIGLYGKLCVAIFVFLSGYGLTVKAEKDGGIKNLKSFYLHRFKKLYLSYWYIWLLFVPVSYFVFGRTFSVVYHDGIVFKLLLDFLGLLNCIGLLGYNATWWFMSCIILLYLLFPLLYKFARTNWPLSIALAMTITFLPLVNVVNPIRYYVITFVLGILYALKILPPPSSKETVFTFLLFLILSVCRIFGDPILIDCILSLLLVHLYTYVRVPNGVAHILEIIGRHSMNIFLFHTFIYYYWFREIIYAPRNPVVIYAFLLAVCLLVSFAIEKLKSLIIHLYHAHFCSLTHL